MDWLTEGYNGIVLAFVPIQAMLLMFYRQRKYPPLRRDRAFAFVVSAGILLLPLCLVTQQPVFYAASYSCLLISLWNYFGKQNPEQFFENRTGLFNRRAFECLMRENASRRYSIVSLCIRNYLDMRELYGERQMDRCLTHIGRWLHEVFPAQNTFYLRNGNFVVQSFAPFDQAEAAERIQARFAESWHVGDVDRFFDVSCALLDSSVRAASVHDIMNCLAMAHHRQDHTVLPDKRPVQVDGAYVDDLRKEVAVKRALEHAVETDSVCVFLQPIVDARTQRIVGAEALARLYDKELGYISPGVFIPIAEKDGSITALGKQVFEKVCKFMSWPETQALGLDWVNVNLSPVQCMNPHLAEEFIAIQRKYGVPAAKIHLEITEESIINLTTLQNQIARMRKEGFRFVLDDYGSGYSNLMMVRNIPFINIKLDMTFVRAHFEDPNTLLPDTIRAFRELGFSITAEGVETSAMALALDEMDTTYLQGFHYARPMPMEDFYVFMKAAGRQAEEEEAGDDCMVAAKSV